MSLSGVNQTITDGALGVVSGSIENILVAIGYASGGVANTLYSFSDPKAVRDKLGSGPLVEQVANVLDVSKRGPVYALVVNSSVPGTAETPVRQTSGSGPVPTTTGAPNDNYQVVIAITRGGAVGVAEFRYSVDGGDTFSGTIATAATYALPGTGVTVAFTTGTYVAGATYEFNCTAPGYSTEDLGNAFDALAESIVEAALIHVVGVPATAAAAAALAIAVQAQMESMVGSCRYARAIIELPDVDDDAIRTAFATVEATRVMAVGGFVEQYSILSKRYYKRPAAWPVVARAVSVKPHRSLGAVEDGALGGIKSLYRDERKTPGLSDARICVLRSHIGKAGFFVEQPWTLSQKDSDYSTLHNCRVIDKGLRVSYQAMLKYVNMDLDMQERQIDVGGVSTTITAISEGTALAIEDEIRQKLSNALEPEGNISSGGVKFTISRTDDILATSTIHTKTGLRPKGYSRFIENEIGFTK